MFNRGRKIEVNRHSARLQSGILWTRLEVDAQFSFAGLFLTFNLQSCQNDSKDLTGYSSTVEIGLIYPTVHYHKLILYGVFACQKSANMYAFNSPCVFEPISPPSCVLYM